MISAILDLAAQLPAGLPDQNAPSKLAYELAELDAAIEAGDGDGTLTEVADVVYYAAKCIHLAASREGVSVDNAMLLAIAKYTLRARPGNPKDDAAERAACRRVLDERS